HAAKGLEWDAVFLVGLSEGLLPLSLAESDDQIAEERRLLYVGITRARVHLELSYARARAGGGRGNRRVSRFLVPLWPEAAPAAPRGSQAPLDVGLLDRLRTWRSQVADQTSRPAFTVLSDSVLDQVARTRPSTFAELAAVRGIGPAKIERFGAQVLALVAGRAV
ncbi:MAG: HRDC domain-containing protein, partial [Actinobacteria bacterium]|nr:HRDC domain-containing protein [Actinomycetota bacterium]